MKVVKVAKEVKVKECERVFQNIPGSQLLSDVQTIFMLPLGSSWVQVLVPSVKVVFQYFVF